ncbi:MAG TPA: hypothetical protein VGR95_04680 [Thermoanaerobaculia bacterium]|jgi:hypothetical protein|nr:hypothetical protein [Thermoanaerobaculia bacterium]
MKHVTAVALVSIISAPYCLAATPAPAKKPAATKKATSASAGKTAAAVPYDTKPFDPTVEALAAGYRGHSFRRTYETAVVVAPKGEFETTAEYQARSKRSMEGLYAFVLDPASTYNADDEVLNVAVQTTDFRIAEDEHEREKEYTIEKRATSQRKYEASNAFGAKTLVTSSTLETFAIVPTIGPFSGGITFPLKVPRADAPALKSNVRALAIGTISGKQEPPKSGHPYNGAFYVQATIDSPNEILDEEFVLRMNLSDIWLFDAKTGAILAKYSQAPGSGKMQLDVYDSKDNDGYAAVTVVGNENLKLKRTATKFGGGCQITVGEVNEIAGMKGGVWGVGNGGVDIGGRRSIVVTAADGSVLFDEPEPTNYGSGLLTAWPNAERAARAMWQASPGGYVEIKNGDLRFASKASLAGFRELWAWGVDNCSFPSIEK